MLAAPKLTFIALQLVIVKLLAMSCLSLSLLAWVSIWIQPYEASEKDADTNQAFNMQLVCHSKHANIYQSNWRQRLKKETSLLFENIKL